MSFHSQLFPERLSYGTRGGAGFMTAIEMTDSGTERRSAEWDSDRHRMMYDVAKSVQDEQDVAEIMDFVICMRGSACGFRFKDFADFSTAEDGVSTPSEPGDAQVAEQIATATPSFQIQKSYVSAIAGSHEGFTRTITRPIPPEFSDHYVRIYWGSELVWESIGSGPATVAQGVQAAIDYSSGRVIFNSTPTAEVRIACTFHVPARFGKAVDEGLAITWEAPGSFNIDTLPIVEITGDQSTAEEEWIENGHLVSGISGNNADDELPTFDVYHQEFTTSGPSMYVMPQCRPNATGNGPTPQTPLASGEFYTGGPMYLISNSSGSSQSLQVQQKLTTGALSGVVTPTANQYAETYWMGNTLGWKTR